jgi:hypothetical protein
MAYSTRWFKFGDGFHQETDDRLLEPGQPRAVENLIKLKNGALGMRLDYDALAVTTPSGNGCKLFDLHEFNGRLVGLGCRTSGTIPIDLYEFVNQPQFAWRPTDPLELPRLCPVTALRNMGRMPNRAQGKTTLTNAKVAAAAGLVAMAYATSTGVTVHIFDPVADSTVLVQEVAGATTPDVIAIGSVFFFTMISAAGTSLSLYRYTPASSTALVALTDAFAAGATITANRAEMRASQSGTEFWAVIARNGTPAVTLRRFDSTGTAVQTITGPAVVLRSFSVFGQAARVHLLAVETSDDHVDLYTYELAGGTLENTSLDLASSSVTTKQPSLCAAATGSNLCVVFQVNAGTSADIVMMGIVPTTHSVAVSPRRWYNTFLESHPSTLGGTELFAGFSPDTGDSRTTIETAGTVATPGSNYLGAIGISSSVANEQVCAFTDKHIATPTVAFAGNCLSDIALDSSTGKSYWVRRIQDDDSRTTPIVSEFVAGSTARRQSAKAGDLLYLAGGAVQVFDGRQLVEACYLEIPRILSIAGTSGGLKTPGAIKQVVAVIESFDAKNKKISSAPSSVSEITLAALETAISVVVATPHSSRKNATNAAYASTIKVALYETLDTSGGEFTLFKSSFAVDDVGFGESKTVTLSAPDSTLEDNGVIYTQAARGALSGPLSFDGPEPAATLFASADTILSGGCPEGPRVQESRPQFISEALNWSDEIGFQRDCRGDVLSVSRLDERRILHTATEIFQMDGPGLDDVGDGDLGAPRRLPSDVGIYGGRQAWQSLVEFGKGQMFQGKSDMLYLLPRGGNTPIGFGDSVRTVLAAYPTITSACYVQETEQVRFTCNNTGATDGIVLVYDVREEEWFTEGPFGTAITAGCQYQSRAILLRSGVAYRQRLAHPPAAFLSNAWRSGVIHPSGPAQEGSVFDVHFFGTFRGNCTITCVVRFDGGSTFTGGKTETLTSYSVTGFAVGDPVDFRWTTDQHKCESVMVDFQVTALAGAATAGVEYNFWAFTTRPMGKAALRGATQMA